jgi:hypothetical protein
MAVEPSGDISTRSARPIPAEVLTTEGFDLPTTDAYDELFD